MGITMKQIAELCNVSVGTVDRALNNRPGISAKTKEKILRIAEQYEYRPDFVAQSLARGRTMSIGLVLFDLYNRSFAQLAGSVEETARKHGYSVDLVLTDKNPATEYEVLRRLRERKTDGIILFPINQGPEYEQFLRSLNTPIVTIGNRVSDGWDYVGIHDRQAMKNATAHVLAKGYRSIVYICPPLAFRNQTNIYTQEERYQGCLEAAADANPAPSLTVIQEKDYIRALAKLPLEHERTAIMCSCDAYALEVLHYLREERKLRVPEDVGLIGFDHIDVLKYVHPKLTTVEYHIEEMGRAAVTRLLQKLDGNQPEAEHKEVIIDFTMIEGESL